MTAGELLTYCTVRLAVLLYLASLAAGLLGSSAHCPAARALWTAGCLLLWAHVLCAFHFIHHWSHEAAYRNTARQTLELTGWDSGGGVYLNYLFLLVWAADAAWWWIGPASYAARPAAARWLVHGLLAFIIFNGAVVFAEGAMRWISLAGFVVVVSAWLMRRWQGPS